MGGRGGVSEWIEGEIEGGEGEEMKE